MTARGRGFITKSATLFGAFLESFTGDLRKLNIYNSNLSIDIDMVQRIKGICGQIAIVRKSPAQTGSARTVVV